MLPFCSSPVPLRNRSTASRLLHHSSTILVQRCFSSAVLLCLCALAGCARLKHPQQSETVYVLAKQTFLRDRIAAVSNRVGSVKNGQKLQLLERGRRFLRVKTEQGEIGWIEEHAVVNPEVVTGFEQLQKAHQHDPVIATAVLRDDGYLHLKPGRDTDRYYLLPEGDHLQLLVRASVPKMLGPQASGSTSSYASKPSVAKARNKSRIAAKNSEEKKPAAAKAGANPPTPLPPAPQPGDGTATQGPGPPTLPNGDPIPMEDWWMVRDSQGKVGWLMSRRLDVDVPEEISAYAEGQRMVGAYLLRKVDDPESNFPDKQAPEYVTALNPYVDGLPYDFNQVRVFTWNLHKHRYETAFRQRNLQGYLPMTVATQTLDKSGPVPTFSFKQGIGDAITIDPETGATRPATTETLAYRLDGALVKKVEAAPPPPTPRVASKQPAASSPNRHHRSRSRAAKKIRKLKHHSGN